MTQITSNPSTKKISDLVGMIRRGELVLQPDFQRKLVWNNKHKEAFIDTILKGFPFPEIYIAQSGVDFETLQTQQVIVDGQQRLSSIMEYIEGKMPCKSIKHFNELNNEDKTSFLGYDIVTRDLKNASSDIIKEVFRRINQTHFNLNDIEINNAIYDGEFISTAKEIQESLTPEDFPIFSGTDISRMADLDYILMIMATIEEGGYFAGSKRAQDYIVQYDESFPNSASIKNKILEVFTYIKSLNIPIDSIWYRKSNFFTLFIELYFCDNIPINIENKLSTFETNILQNKGKEDNDFGKYYSVMYTGTNSRTSRVIRGELLKKYCL